MINLNITDNMVKYSQEKIDNNKEATFYPVFNNPSLGLKFKVTDKARAEIFLSKIICDKEYREEFTKQSGIDITKFQFSDDKYDLIKQLESFIEQLKNQ